MTDDLQFFFWHLTSLLEHSRRLNNCLAEGLNKSFTGFSSFVKHYLDPCLQAFVCTQFMGDIAAGAHVFDEMVPALRETFDCLRDSGLKLSAHKCEFGTTKIVYLGSTITPK